MSTPLFSVIIPTYNRLPLLQHALDTVSSQRHQNYEVIVVDDGSTDGTWDYLTGLNGKVKSIRQSNTGPGAARNSGAEIASGRYLAFLDSDDLWYPWTLEAYAQVITEMNDPAWISGAHSDFDRDSRSLQSHESALEYIRYCDYLETANQPLWLGVPGTAVRRDVFMRIRFDENDTNGEDNDLWLMLGCEKGFGYITAPPVFAYRRHIESRVSDLDFSILGAKRMLSNEQQGAYPGGAERAKERQAIIGTHLRPIVVACARAGRYQDAMTLYRGLLAWNVSDFRIRFLLGVPLLMMVTLISRKGKR